MDTLVLDSKLGLVNEFTFLGDRLELSQQMDYYGMNDTARDKDYG